MRRKKEEVEYKIFNPGGNKTAIVIDKNYDAFEKREINNYILRNNTDVEQVGFISKTQNELKMAGEEFCVNATRCAIWNYLNGNEGEIEIQVSGYSKKIIGGITSDRCVYVELPINREVDKFVETNYVFNFVKLEGILLAVVNENYSKIYIEKLHENEEYLKSYLKEIMKEFQTVEKAVGIVLLEKENEKVKINPIIWVKEIDTLYYETACGSASLATVIYKNCIEKEDVSEIIQPSGNSIFIELEQEDNIIKTAIVKGLVKEE